MKCDAFVTAIDETIEVLERVERDSGSGELGEILRTLSEVRKRSGD